MCLASQTLMGKTDVGEKLFFRIKSPWEQNKSEGTGKGRLNDVQTAQLRSQNKADRYELLALLLALLLHD